MSSNRAYFLSILGAIIGGLFVLALIIMVWIPPLHALRLVFGTVFMFFLPGFAMVENAFPHQANKPENNAIDWIERIALSVGLSIAIVPLLVYGFSRLGVQLNAWNIFFEIAGLVIVLALLYPVTKAMKKRLNA